MPKSGEKFLVWEDKKVKNKVKWVTSILNYGEESDGLGPKEGSSKVYMKWEKLDNVRGGG